MTVSYSAYWSPASRTPADLGLTVAAGEHAVGERLDRIRAERTDG